MIESPWIVGKQRLDSDKIKDNHISAQEHQKQKCNMSKSIMASGRLRVGGGMDMKNDNNTPLPGWNLNAQRTFSDFY